MTNVALPTADGGQQISEVIDYDLVGQQLDYLDAVKGSNVELSIMIELLGEQAEKHQLTKENVEGIAEEIAKVGDQTKDLEGKTAELQAQAEETAHQLHDAMFPTDADVDTSALESLSEQIQEISVSAEELADTLKEDSRTAEDVAESILRFDDAIQNVVDNYDDWMGALNSGSLQEQAEAIDGLRDAYADLLDLDGSALSDDFLTNAENLELMKAAIDGDTAAYDELLSRAGQDIVAHLKISDEDYNQFMADLNTVQSSLDAMNFQTLEIGTNLDIGNFLQ